MHDEPEEALMIDVKVRSLGSKKFEISARGHQVISDQPHDEDGSDAGMTPPELFLGSLGACAAYYAEEYLLARGLPRADLEVRVSALKGEHPARITTVHLDVIAPGLPERHKIGILRAVNACLIKNTLHHAPQIITRLGCSADVLEAELAQVG
jgi:putative redox protein